MVIRARTSNPKGIAVVSQSEKLDGCQSLFERTALRAFIRWRKTWPEGKCLSVGTATGEAIQMKRLIFAAMFSIGLISSANAALVFRGSYEVFSAVNCSNGPTAGDFQNSWFYPRNVGGNGNETAITVVHPIHSASSYRLNGTDFTSTFQEVLTGGLGSNGAYLGTDAKTFVRVTSATPALSSITATTPQVSIVGQMKNPWGDIGSENCVITFRVTYLRDF